MHVKTGKDIYSQHTTRQGTFGGARAPAGPGSAWWRTSRRSLSPHHSLHLRLTPSHTAACRCGGEALGCNRKRLTHQNPRRVASTHCASTRLRLSSSVYCCSRGIPFALTSTSFGKKFSLSMSSQLLSPEWCKKRVGMTATADWSLQQKNKQKILSHLSCWGWCCAGWGRGASASLESRSQISRCCWPAPGCSGRGTSCPAFSPRPSPAAGCRWSAAGAATGRKCAFPRHGGSRSGRGRAHPAWTVRWNRCSEGGGPSAFCTSLMPWLKARENLLWHVPCERVHSVPADLRVNEDESADAAEDFGPSWFQLHLVQRVHAQVEEIQVRDVGHNSADLAIRKSWQVNSALDVFSHQQSFLLFKGKKAENKTMFESHPTSTQSLSWFLERSSSTTWPQKAAIVDPSPDVVIPQSLRTKALGKNRRSANTSRKRKG